jgi:hypothetical protein
MNDKELCEMFGTSLEQVDADAAMYESGSFDGVEFSEPITGKPSSDDASCWSSLSCITSCQPLLLGQ